MEFKALQAEMIQALKAGQKERKESISMLVAAVKKMAIDAGCRDNIPDDMVDQAILKEVKSAKEQIDTCPASRQDLLEQLRRRNRVPHLASRQLAWVNLLSCISQKLAKTMMSALRIRIQRALHMRGT